MSDEPQAEDRERRAYEACAREGGCKYCGSPDTIRYGRKRGVQVRKCKACGHTFEDNGRLPRMRTSTDVIARGIKDHTYGLSFKWVGNGLRTPRDKSTVWRWQMKYAPMVRAFTDSFRAELSETWHADETAIGIGGNHAWTWFCEDERTRMIAASLVTAWGRTSEDATRLLAAAKIKSRTRPLHVVTDKGPFYIDAVRKNFYSNAEGRLHLNRIHFTKGPNNNLIERMNGTFKDRTKSLRGFKTFDGAKAFADAFVVQYDFLRPHETLDSVTPAVAAGIRLPFEDGWGDLCRWATWWRNGRRET